MKTKTMEIIERTTLSIAIACALIVAVCSAILFVIPKKADEGFPANTVEMVIQSKACQECHVPKCGRYEAYRPGYWSPDEAHTENQK